MKATTQAILAAALLTSVDAKKCSSPAKCCANLAKAGLKGHILDPSMALYDEIMGTYWSASAAIEPHCIALPETVEDVSKIMKVVSANDCRFGVRGGGHGAFAGSNSIKNGLTIDFTYINATTYNEDTGLASISPGAHWQDVYNALDPYGLTVTGGRAGTVGTGGFITGGGNSFHSASHGMACDTVANWNLVLADGTITTANATHNEDLFSALKGGSANFGLVTSFDMYPIAFENGDPRIWGGNLFYDLDNGDAVLEAFSEFTENQHKDENTTSLVYWGYLPSVTGGYIINAAVENTRAIVKPPTVDVYYDAGVIDDTTEVAKMSTITMELGGGQPGGMHNVWMTSSFLNDVSVMKYAVDEYKKLNAALEELMPSAESGLNTLCMFQPLTKSIAEKGTLAGGNVMGLDELVKQGNGVMFEITFGVSGPRAEEFETLARPLLTAYMDDIDAFAQAAGVWWPWVYLNYADGTQDPLASVGEKAIAKIQAVSAKYDPAGVFQTLRASGHKIPQ